MKLLLDNNLSPRLIERLDDLSPDSSHVNLLGLASASDIEVWNTARERGYCLVSKDSDFNDLVAARGFPPKVIWLRIGNCTTTQIEVLIRASYEEIKTFSSSDSAGLLELQ